MAAHRSASPRRTTTTPLPQIPEASPGPAHPPPFRTITPGPNSFAQQAAAVDRHRLQSNAFYQQEMARRVTPPTSLHPALRQGFRVESPANMTTTRDSGVTTLSPFVNVDYLAPPPPPTPPLKLVPEECDESQPTGRGVIEDEREQHIHEVSGTDTEHTPVRTYKYTPKLGTSEFSKSVGHTEATPKKKRGGVLDWGLSSSDQTKSPKKGLFEKLKASIPRPSNNNNTGTTSSPAVGRGYGGGESLPPKPKAVLGSSPHKSNVARSPSKRKGLFSRITTEQSHFDGFKSSLSRRSGDSEARSAPSTSAGTAHSMESSNKTPKTAHTAFSDPSYDRQVKEKRAFSETHSEAGGVSAHQKKENSTCGVARTQSLQYFDRAVPPTPPAKNTPPHEKELKAQEEARRIMEHHQQSAERRIKEVTRKFTPQQMAQQKTSSKLPSPLHQHIFENDDAEETPTRQTVKLKGVDGRASPTKSGGYARKDVPRLVKQPSVYSMHASFYPDLEEQYSLQEMKKRTDGLGLEGLTRLPDGFCNRDPKITYYSPSIYSEDCWSTRAELSGRASPSPSNVIKRSPSLRSQYRPTSAKASFGTKDSSSTEGTIPLVYPDLASDPSRTNLIIPARESSRQAHDTYHRASSHVRAPSRSSLAHERRTSPPKRSSPTHGASPFASKTKINPLDTAPPLSRPAFEHPSAAPSPLDILPALAYTPPKAKALGQAMASRAEQTVTPSRSRGRIESHRSTGLPVTEHAMAPDPKAQQQPQLSTSAPSMSSSFTAARYVDRPFEGRPSLSCNVRNAVSAMDSRLDTPETGGHERGTSPAPDAMTKTPTITLSPAWPPQDRSGTRSLSPVMCTEIAPSFERSPSPVGAAQSVEEQKPQPSKFDRQAARTAFHAGSPQIESGSEQATFNHSSSPIVSHPVVPQADNFAPPNRYDRRAARVAYHAGTSHVAMQPEPQRQDRIPAPIDTGIASFSETSRHESRDRPSVDKLEQIMSMLRGMQDQQSGSNHTALAQLEERIQQRLEAQMRAMFNQRSSEPCPATPDSGPGNSESLSSSVDTRGDRHG